MHHPRGVLPPTLSLVVAFLLAAGSVLTVPAVQARASINQRDAAPSAAGPGHSMPSADQVGGDAVDPQQGPHEHDIGGHADPFRGPTPAEVWATGMKTVAGRCAGAFVSDPGPGLPPGLSAALGGEACTHGGDYLATPASQGVAPHLDPGYVAPGIPCYASGSRVHVFYGYLSGGTNRAVAMDARLRESIARLDDIFAVAAASTGAIRHVRWLMDGGCNLVITPVTLSSSLINGTSPGPIRANLISRGLMSSAEKGLIFTDDPSSPGNLCGIAEWQVDESTSASNKNNSGAMLARVFKDCWAPTGAIDLAAEVGAHELSHTLGAVGNTAPNSSYRTGGQAHCTDGIDLMCYDDGGGTPRAVCDDVFPPMLDCNKDDYFNPNPPSGSYLATHWNTASNKFLATTAPGSWEVPPRPSANLTSPATSVVAGTFTATATATAPSGGATIVGVEFWLGDELQSTDTTAPYSATISTLPEDGGFPNGQVLELAAVAIDSEGRTGPSVVSVTIGNPKVRLTTPSAWAVLPSSSVAWSAAASAGPGRTVSKVELLDGASVIATDSSSPYGGTVSLDVGSHDLRARVTDSGGVVRYSPTRTVDRRSSGPQVSLISPGLYEYAAFATGQVQHLAATAVADPGRTVTSVVFKANGSVVGSDSSAPYEVSWTPSVASNYDITAEATDSTAAVGVSEVSSISVTDLPGTSVTITSPADQASVSGSVGVSVSFTLPAGTWVVNSLDIQVDGSSYATLYPASGVRSGSTTVNLAGLVGRHVLRAVLDAYDANTFDYRFVASAGTILALPGSIGIVSPAAGATLIGDVTIKGSATGTSASSLDAYFGSDLYLGYLPGPGFSDTLDTTQFEDGTTTLRLSDSSGSLSSAPITVTLKNASAAISTPAANAVITDPVTFAATASSDAGAYVEQVRFLVDGVDVGGDWSAPYQLPDGLHAVANGPHTVRADAILTDGRTLSSTTRSITLKAGLVTRLAGGDRYATAAAISAASFAPGVAVAYVATGLSFPDALAGAAVAGRDGAPVLLVPGTSIPASIATELTRLQPGRIVVLGGTGVVSDAVMSALGAFTTGPVTRLAGASRYATAAAISAASFAPGVAVAYVATGLSFPDALAGAAAAGRDGAPVLLVPGTSIPEAIAAELDRLQPGRIVVLGGTGVVSDAVKSALAAFTTGTVTRLAGANRYATAAAISAASFSTNAAVAYVATGLSFPDALAGAAVAGRDGGPVLLVPGTSIPTDIATELTRLKPARIVVLGGTGVVSNTVKTSLVAYAAT